MPQYYRLHDLHLRATSDHPAARRLLHRTLRYKGARHAGAETTLPSDGIDATLDFSVDRVPASPPEDARHIDISEHPGIDVWKTSNRIILRREGTTVDLNSEAGVAEAAIATDLLDAPTSRRDQALVYFLAAFSLAILLRARGWFPLHAAGLAHGGRGALLTAGSGSGKSTAALSLVRNGWTYLSDDTVLLRSEEDQIRAYSFRRDFCVDASIAAHFPELDGLEWPPSLSDPAKWQVDPGRLYPGQSAAACTPRLLVLPQLVDAPESRVEPVGTKPALERLLDQGGFFLAPGSDAADRHLAVLRRLIDQARTYRFYAGRDVLEDPRTVHTLLAPLLEDAPTPGAR